MDRATARVVLRPLKRFGIDWFAESLVDLLCERPEFARQVYALNILAGDVLCYFFGNEWTIQHAICGVDAVKRQYLAGRKFFGSDLMDNTSQSRHLHKLADLAEILVNLEGTPGLRERVIALRDTSVEATYAELESASHFSYPPMRFRFVDPSGKKGSDYEAEVTSPSGRTVFCEFKCKFEETQPSSKSLLNSIIAGRRQLPADRPGIVVVRVPEAWNGNAGVDSEKNEAVEAAFRGSDRLTAVVLLWTEWTEPSPETFVAHRMRGTYRNHASKQFDHDIEYLLSRMGHPEHWISLQNVARRVLAKVQHRLGQQLPD